eukprot:TRINITY_DN313_c0_g1_i4.p1 TRINITY_DN313_c0_g1~~TRINITY_DN313_c0_g1_i4.p1  ORF type:complete len:508 (-),score=73.27 TRINITY_DN313_c0_g1_i4:117-1640(-)
MSPKTCDLDPLPTSLFFECIDEILPALTNILNVSLSTGVVPTCLKNALVMPLLKKVSLDPNVLKNFRPVSNIPFVSKLLEKIVLSQLLSHLENNGLWQIFQSAYRPCHSTETALLRVFNDLLVASDSSQISVLTLLDLSSAFDTIDHSILLDRLKLAFGVRDTALKFFESYLTDRKQVVSVLGYESDPSPLCYGVPQGSVLGPILFILYTHPLSDVISHHRIHHHMFADDTELYNSANRSHSDVLFSTMQSCISDVKAWTLVNKLQLNEDKTEALLIDSSNLSDLPSSLFLGQQTNIAFSVSARNLGVIVDNRLTMKDQVSKICQNTYLEIRKIASIRRFLTTEATKTLITSLVISRLDYCNSLLAGIPKKDIDRVQKVMNCAARLIFRAPKREHITPLLAELHWLPISFRVEYKIATICYNIISGSAPPYLQELLQVYTPSRSLRSSADTRTFHLPNRRKKHQGQRAFSYIGPVIWNKLPFSVRHSQSLSSFKSALKTHLFHSYYD